MDIADFTRSAEVNDGYRYVVVAVDIFTKICHDAPIKDKTPEESIRAFNEVLEKIGAPEVISHDNEGSWNSTQFIILINSHTNKHIITSTPPPFAERMVQTIKNMIHQRLEGLEISKEQWVDILTSVLKEYNNTKHSTTGLAPNEATTKDNHFDVWLNINNKATYNRKYPPIKLGGQVRTDVKPKSMKKGTVSVWSKDVYTIAFIKYKQCLINDHRQRVWNRWELLKIESAEGKDGLS